MKDTKTVMKICTQLNTKTERNESDGESILETI